MKRRFEFRLARLARVRGVREREARAAWSAAEAEARAAEEALLAATARRRTAERSLAATLGGGALDPRGVLLAHESVDRLAAAERERREAARTLRWQADRQRDLWRESERDRQALEKLEERDRRRHREDLARSDQLVLDELASTRFARAGTAAGSSPGAAGADAGTRVSPPAP